MRAEPFEVDLPATQRCGYLRPRYPSTFWRLFNQYWIAGLMCMLAALFVGLSSSVVLGGLSLALAAFAAILGRRLFRLAPIGNSASSPSIESVAAAFRRIGWVVDQEHDRWVSGLTSNRIFFPRHRVTAVSIGSRLFFNSHPWYRGGLDAAFERNRRMLERALSQQRPAA